MESYADITPLFDLGQATNFSQLPDDDFLALLQKQFPGANHGNQFLSGFGDGVNPQNLSQFSFPSSISPTSENSSPSPPNSNKNDGNKQSPEGQVDEVTESALKRKASDDDFEEGPSQKNQHTALGRQKGGTTKRKASGPGADESRLLKRKEQNRAAQRAFRERKEKHVRDLEDKVAALEAKNEATTSENENLRDLLSRLQSENMALRQQAQSFTFTVPKSTTSTAPPTNEKNPQFFSDNSMFSTLPRISYTAPDPTNYSNPLDMTSMMSFNPNVLNLLDETPQQTATDNATRMDFGFGDHKTSSSNNNNNNNNSDNQDNQNNQNNQNHNGNNNDSGWLPYTSNLTTLTTNPAYFSLASAFSDSSPPPAPVPAPVPNEQSSFSFDIGSLTQWPSTSNDAGTLDDLFGGYFNPPQPMDVDALIRGSPSSSSSFNSSMSPVVHHANMRSPITSASSSPASHASDASLFSARESSSSESETGHDESQCPKSKEEARQRIMSGGASPFVEQANNSKRLHEACTEAIKSAEPSPFVGMTDPHEAQLMKSVACQRGSGFPSTEQNEHNVEVLTAWRNITRDPQFKECDITKLCSEFASKARCDGSKVVLEPSGVSSIREALSSKKH